MQLLHCQIIVSGKKGIVVKRGRGHHCHVMHGRRMSKKNAFLAQIAILKLTFQFVALEVQIRCEHSKACVKSAVRVRPTHACTS